MKKLLVLFIVLAFVSCNSGNKKTTDEKSAVTTEELVEATVNIGGMHCDMCVASIEKGVNELEGIESVAVSLTDSTAMVKFDASKVDLTKIGKAIKKRGYSVKESSSN
jgi:copper chaperone